MRQLKLKNTKSKAGRRVICLTTGTMNDLRAHREAQRMRGRDVEAALVFSSDRGGFLRQGNFQRTVWRPTLTRSGLPYVRPYVTRHTVATLLHAADVNNMVVSKRLGLSAISTTLKHYGPIRSSMQE